MKGEIFVALVEHLEDTLGYAELDRILVEADLPSRGAYTAVGLYAPEEVLKIVTHAAPVIGVSVDAVVHAFGEHLFERLAGQRPDVVAAAGGTFALLPQIQAVIHRDVLKLDPKAELPSIDVERLDPNTVALTYTSTRPLAELAHGLLCGVVRHYGENIDIEQVGLDGPPGTHARFTLTSRD